MKLIARGAEAELYRVEWQSRPALLKKRVKKLYRIKELDLRLRKQRTRKEAKLLSDSRRAGIATPQVYQVKEYKLWLQFLEGERVKEFLPQCSQKQQVAIAANVGRSIGKLHRAGLIHGDLTTSNLIKQNDKIYFFDFGLGEHSRSTETKAVDLNLLLHALKSTHFDIWQDFWNLCIKAYSKQLDSAKILSRLAEIKKRARYRS